MYRVIQLRSFDENSQTTVSPMAQWPNLKNLNGGLNLSRGLNMVGST